MPPLAPSPPSPAPPASPPPPALPSKPVLTPGTPVNIVGPSGGLVRNDNTTSMAYVGAGDGTSLAEQYSFFHSAQPSDLSPIIPGKMTYISNALTGLFCRLAPASPAGTVPAGCPANQAMVCDQRSASTATVLSYNGNGLAYQGTPLVQAPGTSTLLLSSDPACSIANGSSLSFVPPGSQPAGEWQLIRCTTATMQQCQQQRQH